MVWEKEYEHWRDKYHTWGPGIDDCRIISPEEQEAAKRMMLEYEAELEKIRVKPRVEYVEKGKQLEQYYVLLTNPIESIDKMSNHNDIHNMILDACRTAAETLGYSLELLDKKIDSDSITVCIDYIGFIPNKGGNLHHYVVNGIKNPTDALQLVADFFVLGKHATTYYQNHIVSISDSAQLRKEMERWGIVFTDMQSALGSKIKNASEKTASNDHRLSKIRIERDFEKN